MCDFHKGINLGNLNVLSKGNIRDVGTEMTESGEAQREESTSLLSK